MLFSIAMILSFSPLSGCAAPGDDSGAVVDSGDPVDTHDDFECPTPELHVNGDDPPVVGDYWEVFLWCDDTLMTGTMLMRIDPPALADIEDYHLTFNEAGAGTLFVQVGSIRGERTVDVGSVP